MAMQHEDGWPAVHDLYPMCNFSSVWMVGWKPTMFQVSVYTAVTIFRVKEAKGGRSSILRCTVRATHQTIHPKDHYCNVCWNVGTTSISYATKTQQPKLQTWMQLNTALRRSSNQYIGCWVTMCMCYNLHHYAWPVGSVSEGQGFHWSHKFVYESWYLHH